MRKRNQALDFLVKSLCLKDVLPIRRPGLSCDLNAIQIQMQCSLGVSSSPFLSLVFLTWKMQVTMKSLRGHGELR